MLYRLFIADPTRTEGRVLYLSQPRTAAQIADLKRNYAYVRAVPILWDDSEPTLVSVIRPRGIDHGSSL